MAETYILVNDVPVPCPDLLAWGRWMQTANRRIARTRVGDDREVSTVFLGLNHNFAAGPPLLYETMVFDGGGPYVDSPRMERYATWAEAVRGHWLMVARLLTEQTPEAPPLTPVAADPPVRYIRLPK